MDQRQSQPTHHEQSRGWAQRCHSNQANSSHNIPATYGIDDSHVQPISHSQQAAYRSWYQEDELTGEREERSPWSAYSSIASEEYFNQQLQAAYHLPQYDTPTLSHGQPYVHPSSWPDQPSASRRSNIEYMHTPYTSHSNPPSGQYPTLSSMSRLEHSEMLSQQGRARHGDRISVASRSSSQTLGPYTSTTLQPPRDTSTPGTSNVEFTISHTPPFVEALHRGFIQATPLAEPSARVNETSQFVVPSSRIPRKEGSPYPTASSRATTPRAPHPPDVPLDTKPKRRRANATQLKLLNETYARTMFPTTEERAEIARRINMTPRQVQIWFQNRRQASRQMQVSASPVSFGSQPDPWTTISEHHEEPSSSMTLPRTDSRFSYDERGAR